MGSAADSTKAILNGRGISHVVVVDDQVAPPAWYRLVDLLDSETKMEIGQDTEFNLLSHDWPDRLDLADQETRKLVAAKVNAAANDLGIPRPEPEARDPSLIALQQILSSHQPLQLTPNQWEERADELLERAATEPTLFLIDQRLEAGREGGSLIKSLLEISSEGCFYCILTADTTIENELEYWQQQCKKYGLEPHRVGIVAKAHLNGDQLGFARMLKISLTAPAVKDVQDRVLVEAKKGLKEALKQFSEIDLQTLTSIVFESSHTEGTWEVDTILRVLRAFIGESLDNGVYGDRRIADAVQEIAAAASVRTGADERLSQLAFKIQHAERYVTGDYLSSRRVALANGDLFEVTDSNDSKNLWVLVGQACDLVIRSNGKRSGSPTHLTVLPVEQREKTPRGAHVELLHYLPPGSGRVFVRLTAPAYVPTSILDLAAFSATGEAVWVSGAEMEAMGVVGWQKRADRVSDQLGDAMDAHTELTDLNDEGRRLIVEFGLPTADKPEIHPAVGEDNVRYPIRRVGRLRERQAETVLQAFGLAISRTAEVHDLARISP